MRKSRHIVVLLTLIVLLSGVCFGANNVLIINGASTTSETGTTTSITTNLSSLITAAGAIPTVVDAPPSSLAGYQQVWDIRFSNSSPLTASNISLYLSYLQGGGVLFVMGENSGFPTRNNSVISLISTVGGGLTSFITPASTQTVVAPFTGPNAVTTITYLAPGGLSGGVSTPGNGTYMTVDASNHGTGIYWPKGRMSSATNGFMAIVFDVNFMETTASTASQNFLKNLIGVFVGVSTLSAPTAIPALSDWALAGLALLMIGMALMFMKRSASAS